MLPLKRILCPIDFSEFSLQSLEKAGELATHFGAELCVLHVTHPVEINYNLDPYLGAVSWNEGEGAEALRECAQSKLHELIKTPRFEASAPRPLLREGNPADEIVGAAIDEHADLIVIPTHGLGGWRHLVFGSVAEKVIRLAHCPVLVTHANHDTANDAAHDVEKVE